MQVYNDELYHYGKKGMKWGHRIKRSIHAQNQMVKDQFLHPVHSTKAQLSLLKKSPMKALNMSTKDIENLNKDVKNRVANEAQKKKKIKEYEKQINAGESTFGRIYNKLTDAGRYQAEIKYNQEHKRR